MMQTVEKQIWELLEPGIAELGLRLVRARLSGGSGNSLLQLMVEPVESSAEKMVSVQVDQCAEVSRMASAILDVEDPIEGAYTLEVSSTGLERPLVVAGDFDEYKDMNVKIRMQFPVEERRVHVGLLKGMDGDNVTLIQEDTGNEVKLPYGSIHYAHLIFSDEDIQKMINAKRD